MEVKIKMVNKKGQYTDVEKGIPVPSRLQGKTYSEIRDQPITDDEEIDFLLKMHQKAEKNNDQRQPETII